MCFWPICMLMLAAESFSINHQQGALRGFG